MKKPELVAEAIRLERETHRAMRQPPIEGWKGLNLTVPQLKSLSFISHSVKSSPGRLAAALSVTPPNVTGIVDRLVEQGLVMRRESDQDRRVLLLEVTEKGEGILADLREARINTMQEVLGRLHESELECLVKGYESLLKAAQARLKEIEDKAGKTPAERVEPSGTR